ncbi:unnamed protein product [marine sediment metagenome]|uniref:Uncharacterized protein n=1 Tax=marine sediment metagenome TaxID=412755 RepID=X0YQY5_9ZZZZ
MVKKNKIVSRRGSEVQLLGSGDKAGLTCIGEICFNASTGKVEIELKRESCPKDFLRNLVYKVTEGREVEFVLPPGGIEE